MYHQIIFHACRNLKLGYYFIRLKKKLSSSNELYRIRIYFYIKKIAVHIHKNL